MARTTIQAERIMPYAPEALCKLVGDVREYPKFIPWLQSLKVTKEEPKGHGGWEGQADAVVGWKSFTERFTSKVRCEPEKGELDVGMVRGPFHTLDNRWRFEPHEAGAKVKFWIAYEFKNPLLQAAVNANRDKLANRIMGAFEKEAKRRLG